MDKPMINLVKFDVVRETPKGYWIMVDYQEKWCSKDATACFAYKYKEDALRNLNARTKTYIRILRSRLERAITFIGMTEDNVTEWSKKDYRLTESI